MVLVRELAHTDTCICNCVLQIYQQAALSYELGQTIQSCIYALSYQLIHKTKNNPPPKKK